MNALTLAFAGAVVAAPLSVNTTPANHPVVVALVNPAPAAPAKKAQPFGPDIAALLTPQQIQDAWKDYVEATFSIEHSP